MTLLLTERDVAACLDMASLIPLMRETLARFSRGECVQPVRSSLRIRPAEGFYSAMPAHIRDGAGPGALGLKSVSFFPANDAAGVPTHLATILYLDAATGALLAMMDGRLITEMRTAAVSAVSVELLARPDAATLAILGSGVQAKSHLEAISLVRRLKHVRVWSRRPERAFRFAHVGSAAAPCPVSAVTNVADAVRGADIVVTVTNAEQPIFTSGMLEPGMHLCVVGSSHPRYREVDTDTVLRSRAFVDSREAMKVEAGDFLIPVKEGQLDWSHVLGELGDVANGTFRRESREEITLFKSLGLAVEDVATARLVYERAAARGLGTRWEGA
jgi:ornithine cyclodeaminase/alanine dehydrogenase-like protein (mu-crystallin family)